MHVENCLPVVSGGRWDISTGFRWRALYGDQKFPKGYMIHGIDISHYQGDIDWSKLQNATIEGQPLGFIMIKATEGASEMDENFNDNFYPIGVF